MDASAGLRAAQLSLTSALLEQPALLEELCAIPLRGAEPLHHWEAAELHELQWPPLVAAAARDREWIEQLDTELADTGLVDAQFVRSLDAVRRHSYATGAVGTPGSSLCLRTASEAMERLGVPRGRPSEFAAACGWRRNDELLIEEGWANPDPNPDPNPNPKRAASLPWSTAESRSSPSATPLILRTTSKTRTPPAAAGLPGSTSVTRFRGPLIVMPNGRSADRRLSLIATLLTGASGREASSEVERLLERREAAAMLCLPRAFGDSPSDSSTSSPPWREWPSPSGSSRLVRSGEQRQHRVRRHRIGQPRQPTTAAT